MSQLIQNFKEIETFHKIPATPMQRLSCYFVDAILIGHPIILFLVFPYLFFILPNFQGGIFWFPVIFILVKSYYLLDLKGGTVGRRVTGVKLVSDSTLTTPGFWKIVLRIIIKSIPFNEVFSLLLILLRKDNKALHDIIMKTSVVRKS